MYGETAKASRKNIPRRKQANYQAERQAANRRSEEERTSNSIAGELAGDFMFWRTGKHHFGWFLEPAYDYSFAGSHEQSVGMSAGLLIGIR